MFANDTYGCCVISGRAHQTLRFELIEQKAKIQITDKEVIAEYLKETGGVDASLVVVEVFIIDHGAFDNLVISTETVCLGDQGVR